jgi:hypothetical protein
MKQNAFVGTRRLGRQLVTRGAFALLVTVAGAASAAGPDLLAWPDCPPGEAYAFSFSGPLPAHFQPSPLAGPSGGSCSLDVVSGGTFVPAANSAGGVAFATPGEVTGDTYTLSFDFQWVSGQNDWMFANETGSGDLNDLSFPIAFPGDHCWHHYEYTASLGPLGAKPTLFVYQANAGPEEMRVDNMTLTLASQGAHVGLKVGSATRCACGSAS